MKISFIMQTYLGTYPGSRSNSDLKFLRAVQSFIDQSDKDSELIIVSDGCMITHDLYYKHYKDNPRIKYVYVDKDTPNMYDGEVKYYRGLPRQIGRSLVTGEITAYMDSDDLLISNAVTILKTCWNKCIDSDWLINQAWYENGYRKFNRLEGEELLYEDPKNEPLLKIKGLDSLWYVIKGIPNCIPMQPWTLSHKSTCTTKWEDTISSPSEDVYFNKRLRTEYEKGVVYSTPFYVRCHYPNLWDY